MARIRNLIIPASPLSVGDVQERLRRNVLTLAYVCADLVGDHEGLRFAERHGLVESGRYSWTVRSTSTWTVPGLVNGLARAPRPSNLERGRRRLPVRRMR